jgi:hypothetical protein
MIIFRNERLSFSMEIKFDFGPICTLYAVQLNLIPILGFF